MASELEQIVVTKFNGLTIKSSGERVQVVGKRYSFSVITDKKPKDISEIIKNDIISRDLGSEVNGYLEGGRSAYQDGVEISYIAFWYKHLPTPKP